MLRPAARSNDCRLFTAASAYSERAAGASEPELQGIRKSEFRRHVGRHVPGTMAGRALTTLLARSAFARVAGPASRTYQGMPAGSPTRGMLSRSVLLQRFPPRTETAEAACMETCWRGYNGALEPETAPSTPLRESFAGGPDFRTPLLSEAGRKGDLDMVPDRKWSDDPTIDERGELAQGMPARVLPVRPPRLMRRR